MAGPDKKDPVDTMATIDTPAKASPPREKPPPPHKEEKTPVSSTTPPPDGGWGWVVVFASFMIHIIGRLLPSGNLLSGSTRTGEPFSVPLIEMQLTFLWPHLGSGDLYQQPYMDIDKLLLRTCLTN
jgi:hypothetical protein